MGSADDRIQDIVSSIEHYHTCKNAAEDATQAADAIIEVDSDEDMGAIDELASTEQPCILSNASITEAMIAEVKANAANGCDAKYGNEAIEIGHLKGIFTTQVAPIRSSARQGTISDVGTLKQWQLMLQKALDTSNELNGLSNTGNANQDQGDVSRMDAIPTSHPGSGVFPLAYTLEGLDPASYDQLFPEQRRAFDTVRNHLSQTLNAANSLTEPPRQLLMLLVGEGGTGKSKVVQTITSEFQRRGVGRMLLKSAYTGMYYDSSLLVYTSFNVVHGALN
jgi:hypothetical protein